MSHPLFDSAALKPLFEAIDECLLTNQIGLKRRLRGIDKIKNTIKRERAIQQLTGQIQASQQHRLSRQAGLPTPKFSTALPLSARRTEVAKIINSHQVVIVAGETGSGKSTQIPKICLQLKRGVSGMIAHTQPRRIAARAIATRISEELESTLGHAVGYKIRFEQKCGDQTYIKVVTDGVLLAEIEQDRLLMQYDTVIIDEAHERSLNIDFLLGYFKQLLPKRPDLKLIITSATIDTQRFSSHFASAPIIEVSGRLYPVEIRYRPIDESDDDGQALNRAVADALRDAIAQGPGDVLIFLPGEREIRDCRLWLKKHIEKSATPLLLLPLYARLSAADQQRVFQTSATRRVILATNVAETSLTVPGIRFVIDSGLARISRFNAGRKVLRLPIEAISQASANQRSGRCGRVSSGVCYRLYTEDEFDQRPPFTDPEITRTSLASVILRMSSLNLKPDDIQSFPFIDPPHKKQINAGFRLLQELGALDKSKSLTKIGKQLTRLPVDPRIGRMLLAGIELDCLKQMLILAAALEIPDPRVVPFEFRTQAREKHKQWFSGNSDFMALISLWQDYQRHKSGLSQRQLKRWCDAHFLSAFRMREWQALKRQLEIITNQFSSQSSAGNTDEGQIHTALLTGLLGNIALKQERNEYLGSHGKRLVIGAGSAVYPSAGQWIVAAEITDTGKLIARMVATVKPQWIERAAFGQLNFSYAQPHWVATQGKVLVYEKATLYGLTLYTRRKRDYAKVNPSDARDIFIREALTLGQLKINAAFLVHNQQLLNSIREIDHKLRRHNEMMDEDSVYEFYRLKMPSHVCSAAGFKQWRRGVENSNPQFLFMREQDIRTPQVEADFVTKFPDSLKSRGASVALRYLFEPGQKNDGLNINIPIATLNQISSVDFDYLVPGLLAEKVEQMIRSLPKEQRKKFVPVPTTAAEFVAARVDRSLPLVVNLSQFLSNRSGAQILPAMFDSHTLATHLRPHFVLRNHDGSVLENSDELEKLQSEFALQAKHAYSRQTVFAIEKHGIKSWDFEALPEMVTNNDTHTSLTGYPGLVDKVDSVSIQVFETLSQAKLETVAGTRRLLLLALPEQKHFLSKKLPKINALCLLYTQIDSCANLQSDICNTVMEQVFSIAAHPIQSTEEFDQRRQQGTAKVGSVAHELCDLLESILRLHHDLRKKLTGGDEKKKSASDDAMNDIQHQLQGLIYPGFVYATPMNWLHHYPRFLNGIANRIENLSRFPHRDMSSMTQIRPYLDRLHRHTEGGNDETLIQLSEFRWMLEEFRVSLFAQSLKTSAPVSATRLERLWSQLTESVARKES